MDRLSLEPDMMALVDRLLGLLAETGRRLVAIAGPPGGGKSTLCERLDHELNASRPGVAAIVPMDGYHFDDAILREKGTLARKGAPFTFDVGGLQIRADEAPGKRRTRSRCRSSTEPSRSPGRGDA